MGRRCIPFSVVKYRASMIEKNYKRVGLMAQEVHIDSTTTIHCWVPEPSLKSDPEILQRPAVLLIHGFGFTGMLGFEKQVPSLVKRFRVYVPDLVFFGGSTTRGSGRSEFFQAECMKNMLKVLEVDRVSVVGTSYGGFVAYRMAHLFPELVERVVIASSGVCMTPDFNAKILSMHNTDSIADFLMPKTAQGVKQAMQRATSQNLHWLPNFLFDEMLELYYDDRRKERAELLDNLVIGTESAFPLPRLSQDVLVVWGDKDQIFDLSLAKKLIELTGESASLVFIEGAGHVPQIDKFKQFNSTIMKFLSPDKS